MDAFTPSHLPNQMRLLRHIVRGDVASITGRVAAVNRLPIHLGKENMRDGAQHIFRRTFEQIGEPNEKTSLAKPDRIVDIGKAEEFNSQFGNGCPRAELAIRFREQFSQDLGHEIEVSTSIG